MPRIFTRREWSGEYEELGDIWRLTKGWRHARAVVVTHPLGVELRLLIDDDLQQSQMHRDDDTLLDQAEMWKQAMVAKGWT